MLMFGSCVFGNTTSSI